MQLIPPNFRMFRPTIYSLAALETILNASPIQIESSLLALALQQGFYDCYRLKILKQNLSPIQQHELVGLSSIVAKGAKRLLIEEHADFFSINRLWFDYQLNDETRSIIEQKIKLFGK